MTALWDECSVAFRFPCAGARLLSNCPRANEILGDHPIDAVPEHGFERRGPIVEFADGLVASTDDAPAHDCRRFHGNPWLFPGDHRYPFRDVARAAQFRRAADARSV